MAAKFQIAGGPNRYIQGPHALCNVGHYIRSLSLGDNALLVIDPHAMPSIESDLLSSLKDCALSYTLEFFAGECCHPEIQRLCEKAKHTKADLVVGAGGGKTLDTAKAVANACQLALLIAPTIASNDSPCSSLSVLYTPEGVLDHAVFYHRSPDLVIVDSYLLCQAPVRYFVAGIGDALATGYEAEACLQSGGENAFGGVATVGMLHLARLCSQIVFERGLAAKRAVQDRSPTADVEQVLEAVIYLSGLGFESGGVAAAHAIAGGLTSIPRMHVVLHGEEVAFGLLVQFVMENRPLTFLKRSLDFYRSVGLPLTLDGLGLKEPSNDEIDLVALKACREGEPIFNMPFPVDASRVVAAIKEADQIGNAFEAGRL